jgi:hypothetical protein
MKTLTRRQETLFTDKRLALLIERLDLEPVKSEEVLRAEKIEERVEAWIAQIIASPSVPRGIRKDPRTRKMWEEPDLSYLKPGECPF